MDKPSELPQLPQGENPSVGKAGRRRFLGAGGAAAPVILTLFSQPALGVTCFTPSRSLSKNTSLSQAGKDGECTGQSPGNYMAQSNPTSTHGNSYSWPANIPPSTPFHPTFSGARHWLPGNNGGRSRTMLEVLQLNGGSQDPQKIAFHLIAAYLNCVRGLIPAHILTAAKVQGIWTEWDTKGYYEVTAGVKWYAGDIVSYLQTNGIAP